MSREVSPTQLWNNSGIDFEHVEALSYAMFSIVRKKMSIMPGNDHTFVEVASESFATDAAN